MFYFGSWTQHFLHDKHKLFILYKDFILDVCWYLLLRKRSDGPLLGFFVSILQCRVEDKQLKHEARSLVHKVSIKY